MTQPTKTPEQQAREFSKLVIWKLRQITPNSGWEDVLTKELTDLFAKAKERDDYESKIIDLSIKPTNNKQFDSVGEMQVALLKKSHDSLKAKLELAQADCAVKHEALILCSTFGVEKTNTMSGDRHYYCYNCYNENVDGHKNGCIFLKALSTNPGQSLLDELKKLKAQVPANGEWLMAIEKNLLATQDELKLAKEKAEALDWLENRPEWIDIFDFMMDLSEKKPFNILSAIQNAQKDNK